MWRILTKCNYSLIFKIKEEIPEFENYYEIWYLTNAFSSEINTVEFNREVNCYNKQYNLIINGENFKIYSIISLFMSKYSSN